MCSKIKRVTIKQKIKRQLFKCTFLQIGWKPVKPNQNNYLVHVQCTGIYSVVKTLIYTEYCFP